jgi:hypothetical protein
MSTRALQNFCPTTILAPDSWKLNQRFPRDAGEFYRSWLAILCTQIDHVSGALLLLGTEHENSFAAVAVWPDATRNMQFLAQAAEQALKERRGVVVAPDGMPLGTSHHAAHVGYAATAAAPDR